MERINNSHGPDNPRDWDPNHPLLKSGAAPHETAGLMRIHRAGYSGDFIRKAFKLGARTLAKAFEQAMEAENKAARQHRDIHCPPVDPPKAKK
ncbi:hypothetical protein PBI_TOAKA_73 [Mycobacterium phage Toaka]|nr:hypothetical protein PBI_TOAKA_73 [Mycobacterium phage Toaka]